MESIRQNITRKNVGFRKCKKWGSHGLGWRLQPLMSLRMTCGVLLICFSNGDVRACLRPPQADSVVFSRCLMLTKVENPGLAETHMKKFVFF